MAPVVSLVGAPGLDAVTLNIAAAPLIARDGSHIGRLIIFEDITDRAELERIQREIDAVLIDTAINLGEAARSNGRFKVVSQFEQPGGPDQYGGLLPKDTQNAGAVNAALKQLQDSGQLDALAKQDLTADPGTLMTIKTQ